MLAPIQVGRLTIELPLALAPMAGVTSWPFRRLCKEQGCGITMTEFVNDRAILSANAHTLQLMQLLDTERPAAVQIFGHDPETMAAAAAAVVERQQPDFLDLNMGCPAPKITKGLGGSSLLREPDRATTIVSVVRAAIHPVPVTVKMRIGWDRTAINAVEVARRCEEAGAAMITVHGRTRDQHYAGEADWQVIAAVAQAVSIPVLGNGDVCSPQVAERRLRESGVAGLAIGRGALGNPWLFRRIVHYLQHGELLPEPDIPTRVATALRHLEWLVAYIGEYLAVRQMRKHAAWYLKGLPGAAEYRDRVNRAESRNELTRILTSYMEQSAVTGSTH